MLPQLIGYILLGFICGVSQMLPVSASAHEQLLAQFFGLEGYSAFIQAFAHMGCLAALLLRCGKQLGHIRREQHLASISPKRRRRQPDTMAVLDGRLLSGALVPMAAVMVLCQLLVQDVQPVAVCVMLVITGILTYIPQFFPGGNRDSRGISGLDGLLMGVFGGLFLLPGMSRMAGILCVGQLRGYDRKYLLDMALLISAPAVLILVIINAVTVILSGFAGVSAFAFLCGVLAAAASFAGSFCAISVIRHMAVRIGFHAFSYYSWGLAMLSFLLYLFT